MILFFLSNWKTILGVIATAALCYLLHSLDVYRLEAKEQADLKAQAETLNGQCKQEKAITEGVSNDYQQKLSNLNARFDALKRVQPSRCVAVSTAKPAARRDAETANGIVSRQDGVTSDALYDFARDAEQVRLQLLSCQDFINQTQAQTGQ